jgi:membrane protein DedA with SNARE-associated domain
MTLLAEDGTTLAAGWMRSMGIVGSATAFWGCFLGIWVGDMLLYGLGRSGHTLLQRLATGERLEAARHWMSRSGMLALVACRFLPGTRLPTYLAAGLCRMPFGRFVLATGLLAAVWTLLLLGTSDWLRGTFERFREQFGLGPIALGAILCVVGLAVRDRIRHSFGVVLGARRLGCTRTGPNRRRAAERRKATWGRWRRWEFWPGWLFYFPVALNWLRLGARYRGMTLPTAANPGIRHGGLVGESKFETLQELMRSSPQYTAQAWLLEADDPEDRARWLSALTTDQGLAYPLIVKPDLGQRGVGVRRVSSLAEASAVLRQTQGRWVVQRYVPGPREVGIFYRRFPGEDRGSIWAMTDKQFPHVVGDGRRTIEDLIWDHPRLRCQAEVFLRRHGSRLGEILPEGESLRLVHAGNHAQGCLFQDGAHLKTPELEAAIDEIARRLEGFFVGRFDIRFENDNDLRGGRGFQILELNGAGAEATHIYDPSASLLSAYRTLFQQWDMVFAIGADHRRRGVQPTPARQLIACWWEARQTWRNLPAAD